VEKPPQTSPVEGLRLTQALLLYDTKKAQSSNTIEPFYFYVTNK